MKEAEGIRDMIYSSNEVKSGTHQSPKVLYLPKKSKWTAQEPSCPSVCLWSGCGPGACRMFLSLSISLDATRNICSGHRAKPYRTTLRWPLQKAGCTKQAANLERQGATGLL